MADPVDLLRQEMNGRTPVDSDRRQQRQPRPRASRPGYGPRPPVDRPRRPQASERSSILAQAWYDMAGAASLDLPYDVNYFALALQRKVENDSEMVHLLGDGDRVDRWVAKMIERWWAEYVSNDVHARNAKEFFLDVDWDDLREYARSCLRAAYLKEHGRRVPPPEYPNQRDFRQSLDQVENAGSVRRLVETAESDEPLVERELDGDRRERLRSWRRSREDHK